MWWTLREERYLKARIPLDMSDYAAMGTAKPSEKAKDLRAAVVLKNWG